MKIYIIIPAYNEAQFIGRTLHSLVNQTFPPHKIVVVDDNSTDNSLAIIKDFTAKYDFIRSVHHTSLDKGNIPGNKVITAFNKGLDTLDNEYDIICKFDADLIFPTNYLEIIAGHFRNDPEVGMAGGFCTIEKNGKWVVENLTGKDHIRGALKAYRKECFLKIGKLKPAMGWDTADELLATYHGFKIKTDSNLLVQHLKPTGSGYHDKSGHKQGEVFYKLRYGAAISLIAAAKLAFLKKDVRLFRDYLRGYYTAKKEKRPFLVTRDEGRFIRKLRWEKMRKKLAP